MNAPPPNAAPWSATAKFYAGFVIALALIIGLAFFAGYRAGIAHVLHALHAHAAP